jgi:hypothetical protein
MYLFPRQSLCGVASIFWIALLSAQIYNRNNRQRKLGGHVEQYQNSRFRRTSQTSGIFGILINGRSQNIATKLESWKAELIVAISGGILRVVAFQRLS